MLGLGARASDGLVFTCIEGNPVHPDRFSRWFEAHIKRAGLPRIRFHDLRHTHTTLLLGRGVHPKIVSETLGYSTIAITLGLYSHVTTTMQREAAAVMDAMLRG